MGGLNDFTQLTFNAIQRQGYEKVLVGHFVNQTFRRKDN